jgi:PAS domain S-box-containing protein
MAQQLVAGAHENARWGGEDALTAYHAAAKHFREALDSLDAAVRSWEDSQENVGLERIPDAVPQDAIGRIIARATDRLSRLQTTTAALSQALTPEEVAHVIMMEAIAALGATAGSFALLSEDNKEGGTVHLVDAIGYPDEIVERWRRFPQDANLLSAEAIRTAEPVFIESPEFLHARYPAIAAVEHSDREGTKQAWAAIPLLLEGRAIGALCVAFDEPHPFAEDDHGFIMTLAAQCAIALDRARKYSEVEQQRHSTTTVLESITDAFFALDQDWHFTYVNHAFEHYFDMPRGQLLGKRITDLFPVFLDSTLEENYRRVMQEKVPMHFETLSPATRRWVEVHAYPSEQGISVYFQDITERREAEQHLRRVIDNIFTFVGVLIPDGTLVEINRAPLELAGLSFADVAGKKFWDCAWWSNSQVRERVRDTCQSAAHGEISRYDTEIQMADQRLMVVDLMIAPLRNDTGTITHLIPSAVDITERKHVEEELRRHERMFRSLLQNFPNGSVSVFDREYRYLVAEGLALESVGLSSEMLVGKRLTDVFATEQVAHVLPHYERAFTGEIVSFELELANKTYHMEAGPIRAVITEQVDAIIVVAQDITDAKRIAVELAVSREQLRALRGRMEEVVEEERTRISREIHDRLGQALTGLKFDVAWVGRRLRHDSPENAIDLELLRQKVQEILTDIDALVGSVRTLSWELRPPALDDLGLPAAMEWLLDQFSTKTGIKTTTLINPRAALPGLLTPERTTAAYRILQEALTNIARHAAATQVTVQLTFADSETSGEVILRIGDDGIGMAPTPPEGRMYLGLLGMQERAFAVQSSFAVESRPGMGTEVFVRFPANVKVTDGGPNIDADIRCG